MLFFSEAGGSSSRKSLTAMNEVPNRCDFRVGDSIDGYKVEALLGGGAFGNVFKVRQRGVAYALKVLKLWEMEPDAREMLNKRFDMEYETGRIKSDYLVHSVGKGVVNGNPYILMEFCPNGDLEHYMKKHDVDFGLVSKQVLLGLRDLHCNGKVHRDLKLQNVLIDENYNARLTDFGISGDQKNRLTTTNIFGKPLGMFGTYGYMPPEQYNPPKGNATVLPTTDIFSFGVMLYEMITGEMPFGPLRDMNDVAYYFKNCRDGNWNREKLYGKSNPAWEKIIDKCVKNKFEERFQTADAVLDEMYAMRLISENEQRVSYDFKKTVVNGVALHVMQGEEYNKYYKLDQVAGSKQLLTMGRSDDSVSNDITIREINSSYISRRHCTLQTCGCGEWYLRDGQWDVNSRQWRNSTNGTYVNSTQIDNHGVRISVGDIITIGDVKMRVEAY